MMSLSLNGEPSNLDLELELNCADPLDGCPAQRSVTRLLYIQQSKTSSKSTAQERVEYNTLKFIVHRSSIAFDTRCHFPWKILTG